MNNPKKKKTHFEPNKKMTVAAIAKGKAIGLGDDELIEMISLMDKNLSKDEIIKLIDQTPKQVGAF